MKNTFKKVALLCTALLTSISTFTISTGGAVAAGLGAAAGIALIGYGIHKSHEHRSEKSSSSSYASKKKSTMSSKKTSKPKRAQRRDLKKDIKSHTKDIKDHTIELKRLEKKGKRNTPEAQEHKSLISKLESEKTTLVNKLHSL